MMGFQRFKLWLKYAKPKGVNIIFPVKGHAYITYFSAVWEIDATQLGVMNWLFKDS